MVKQKAARKMFQQILGRCCLYCDRLDCSRTTRLPFQIEERLTKWIVGEEGRQRCHDVFVSSIPSSEAMELSDIAPSCSWISPRPGGYFVTFAYLSTVSDGVMKRYLEASKCTVVAICFKC